MRKFIPSIIIIILITVITLRRAYAAPDFSIAFNVNYQVNEKGTTIVQKNIQLTNLTTNVYPAVFSLEIPSDADNISAFDQRGKIVSTIFEENGRKKIKLPLNEKSLGVDKSVQFVLRFETKQIAFQENGSWKIIIPKIESAAEIIGYNLFLEFPQSWGKPFSVTPQPRKNFSWTLEEVKESPIVISFEQQLIPLITTITLNSNKPLSLAPLIGIFLGVFLIFSVYLFLKLRSKYGS